MDGDLKVEGQGQHRGRQALLAGAGSVRRQEPVLGEENEIENALGLVTRVTLVDH